MEDQLFPTLLYFTLLLSTALSSRAEAKKENSQTVADNNNTGENQSAEQSREETPTEENNPSSENDNEDNTKEDANDENEDEVVEANADEENDENVEEIEQENENEQENEKEDEHEHEEENEQEIEQENKESKSDVKPRMGIVKEMHHNGYSSEEKAISIEPEPEGPAPCTCGIFLSSQFKKGSKDQPKGLPVLEQEIDTPFMDNAIGNRQCMHRCLEVIIKHLPKSNDIICATVDKDIVHREKAFLFIKNHAHKWLETKMSAGREFCCKDNLPYKCSKSKRSILSFLHTI